MVKTAYSWPAYSVLLLVLPAYCGCSPQPADRLVGQWQGRPEMQDAKHQARQKHTSQSVSTGERADRETPPAEDDFVLSTVRPLSLLDPFDLTITLHFEDRRNVRMSMAGARENGARRGAWRVVEQTGNQLTIEITPTVPPRGNTVASAAASDPRANSPSETRRFQIVFPTDHRDRFTLTESVAGRQQGSLVFRRQEKVEKSKSPKVKE